MIVLFLVIHLDQLDLCHYFYFQKVTRNSEKKKLSLDLRRKKERRRQDETRRIYIIEINNQKQNSRLFDDNDDYFGCFFCLLSRLTHRLPSSYFIIYSKEIIFFSS